MAITARDYFRLAFDVFRVAWDEQPFLYRILNKAREDVAITINLRETYVHTFEQSEPVDIITLPGFLKIYRVFYVLNNGVTCLLAQASEDYSSGRSSYRTPLWYKIDGSSIVLLPDNYKALAGDSIEIVYCPTLTPLETLDDEETMLDPRYKYMVAYRAAEMLAINLAQYQLSEFFRRQYAIEAMKFVKGGM